MQNLNLANLPSVKLQNLNPNENLLPMGYGFVTDLRVFIGAIDFHLLVTGSNTSPVLRCSSPSCPPIAYSLPVCYICNHSVEDLGMNRYSLKGNCDITLTSGRESTVVKTHNIHVVGSALSFWRKKYGWMQKSNSHPKRKNKMGFGVLRFGVWPLLEKGANLTLVGRSEERRVGY